MAKNTLTDTQRVVLAAAAARESGLVLPLPTSLGNNRGTHGIILKSLIERKLLTERPAQPGETVWRETEDFNRMTLSIAAAGLEAIGIAAETGSPQAGLDLTGGLVGRASWVEVDAAVAKRQVASAATIEPNAGAATGPRAGSKLAILIGVLRRPAGATIPDLMEATGWQAHSIRGAISGALKKKLGIEVSSEATEDRGRVYRMASASDGLTANEISESGAPADPPQVADSDKLTSGEDA
jgi:hypothetical protein